MARVNSTLVSLGTKAPDFNLPDTISGKNVSLGDIKGTLATVVMFICNHCPFVLHVNTELVKLGNDYKNKGVGFVAISANDIINHPHDAPDKMKEVAVQLKYPFPYLYDETQEVAKAYHAACTPDFSIFDADLKCVYRGQLDESRPKNNSVSDGSAIRAALDAILYGNEVNPNQVPSLGCNIKWKTN